MKKPSADTRASHDEAERAIWHANAFGTPKRITLGGPVTRNCPWVSVTLVWSTDRFTESRFIGRAHAN